MLDSDLPQPSAVWRMPLAALAGAVAMFILVAVAVVLRSASRRAPVLPVQCVAERGELRIVCVPN
jgi:hypothetical protein